MSSIDIVETITSPGSIDRFNEDSFGSNSACAFVIDGATGLGDKQFMQSKGTDAAWLASNATMYFEDNISEQADVSEVIRRLILRSMLEFSSATKNTEVPRFAWPSASFAMLHTHEEGAQFIGLGDCTLFLESKDGVEAISPLSKFAGMESANAADHIDRVGGMGTRKNLLDDKETLEGLRAIRSLQNTQASGVWTLGLEALAAENLWCQPVELTPSSFALLCSDGFSALVDAYNCYNKESIVRAAKTTGLRALTEELRHLETVVDPECLNFPR